jgi:transposase
VQHGAFCWSGRFGQGHERSALWMRRGKIIREAKVASESDALLQVPRRAAYHFKRIGLEVGLLSHGCSVCSPKPTCPVICVETRHRRAVLKAQTNKTDRNDAPRYSQMMRVGLYRPVHVKALRSQKLRMLLTHRKLLQSKAIAIKNDLRATLRNFGLKVGIVGTTKYEMVENFPDFIPLVEPLLVVRRVLRETDWRSCWRLSGTTRCAGA